MCKFARPTTTTVFVVLFYFFYSYSSYGYSITVCFWAALCLGFKIDMTTDTQRTSFFLFLLIGCTNNTDPLPLPGGGDSFNAVNSKSTRTLQYCVSRNQSFKPRRNKKFRSNYTIYPRSIDWLIGWLRSYKMTQIGHSPNTTWKNIVLPPKQFVRPINPTICSDDMIHRASMKGGRNRNNDKDRMGADILNLSEDPHFETEIFNFFNPVETMKKTPITSNCDSDIVWTWFLWEMGPRRGGKK